MVIYGTKASKGTPIKTTAQCPFCGESHSVAVLPFHKYFHIYWIPFFPYGREYAVACVSCGKEVPDHYVGGITSEHKSQVSTPIWTFAGLLVIGGGFLVAAISGAFA